MLDKYFFFLPFFFFFFFRLPPPPSGSFRALCLRVESIVFPSQSTYNRTERERRSRDEPLGRTYTHRKLNDGKYHSRDCQDPRKVMVKMPAVHRRQTVWIVSNDKSYHLRNFAPAAVQIPKSVASLCLWCAFGYPCIAEERNVIIVTMCMYAVHAQECSFRKV